MAFSGSEFVPTSIKIYLKRVNGQLKYYAIAFHPQIQFTSLIFHWINWIEL